MLACLERYARSLAIALVVLLFSLPLALLLGGALMPPGAGIHPGAWQPAAWSLAALKAAFATMPLVTGLFNSLLIAALAVPLTLLVASSAASRLQPPRTSSRPAATQNRLV